MDGTKLIDTINKLYPDMKFLIHTGLSDFSLSYYLKKIGLTSEDVLTKPERAFKIFVNKINDIIKGK